MHEFMYDNVVNKTDRSLNDPPVEANRSVTVATAPPLNLIRNDYVRHWNPDSGAPRLYPLRQPVGCTVTEPRDQRCPDMHRALPIRWHRYVQPTTAQPDFPTFVWSDLQPIVPPEIPDTLATYEFPRRRHRVNLLNLSKSFDDPLRPSPHDLINAVVAEVFWRDDQYFAARAHSDRDCLLPPGTATNAVGQNHPTPSNSEGFRVGRHSARTFARSTISPARASTEASSIPAPRSLRLICLRISLCRFSL